MHPILEQERARLAAMQHRYTTEAEPRAIAAAAGISPQTLQRQWYPTIKASTDTLVPPWPEAAAKYILPAVIAALEAAEKPAPAHPVDELYATVLGREPDAEGRAYWCRELEERPLREVRDLFVAAARQAGEIL